MDFRQLETFVMIARLKSFSKAADCLFLTQPTISNHIQNLEKELDSILINRSNKNITLTKAGEVLFSHAMDILNKREQALFSLGMFKGKIEGTLGIACSTVPEQYILPSLLNGFHKIHKDVSFNLFHYDSQQVVDAIVDGELDFGFVGAKDDMKQLHYIDIMEDKLVLIAPYTSKYSSMEQIPLRVLTQEKMILREKGSGTRKILEDTLKKHNIPIESLHVVAYMESTEAIKQCVRKGLGVTIISELAVQDEIKYNLVKKIDIEHVNITRKFYFVYNRFRSLSPLAETFKEFVLSNRPTS